MAYTPDASTMADAVEQAFIEKIAADFFGIDTLEVRNRDSLDFHEVYVRSLKNALKFAFNAGKMSALQTAIGHIEEKMKNK